MIIGIDANEANVSRRVGVSEFAFELLQQFEKYKIDNIKYKIYLKNNPLSDFPKGFTDWEYLVFGPGENVDSICIAYVFIFTKKKT